MTTATTTRRHRRASGAVRKLPSGRWQARYTAPDGALRPLGTFPTKAEADQALAHEVSRMARGVWRDPRLGDQPLGEWFRGWIATRGDLAPSTRALYGRLLERWIDAEVPVTHGPRATLRSVEHTEAAQAYRLLHTGLAQAVSDGLIPANPCAIKGASQRDARHRAERRVVGPEDLWALADAMPERYRAAVVIAFLSGLRAGELFALQRKHVDLDTSTIRVEQSLGRPGAGSGRYASTKSRAGRRTVTLPRLAVDVLAEHLARFTPESRDAVVFGTATGRPLTSGSRTVMFARARAAIGREDLTWHDLRHSAMTLVALTGATLPELMQRAGHSTPRAALHYQHAGDDAQVRIAQRLDAMAPRRRL